MLEANQRRLLSDLLCPPPGFEFDEAIVCTYSLDLLALAGVPLSLSGLEPDAVTSERQVDALALLQSAQRLMGRFTVFCQAGAIHVPTEFRPVFVWLEQAIVQSAPSPSPSAPIPGVFHPKIWFLRFKGADGIRYRIVVSSRNLTFDRSWDIAACLEGDFPPDRRNKYSENSELISFVDALKEHLAVQPGDQLLASHEARVDRFASELARTPLKVVGEDVDWSFWPLGVGRKQRTRTVEGLFAGREGPFARVTDDANLKRGKRRLLVVAPFVDEKLVDRLVDANRRGLSTILVSRADSLDAVAQAMPDAWHEDAALSADREYYSVYSLVETDPSEENGDDIVDPDVKCNELSGLHAKLWVMDDGDKAHVWVGSANATAAAFTRNVECLLQCTGSKSRFGIDRLMGRSDKKDSSALGLMLRRYFKPSDTASLPDLISERALGLALIEICSGKHLTGHASQDQDGNWTLSVTVHNQRKDGYELRARPLSIKGPALPPTEERWLYQGLPLHELTEFWVLELCSETDEPVSKSAVVRIPTEGIPEFMDRAQANLQRHLRDADSLAIYLELLLSREASELGPTIRSLRRRHLASSRGRGSYSRPLFETMLQALVADDRQFAEIEALIPDARPLFSGDASAAEASHLQMAPLWKLVRQARAQAMGRKL